MKKKPSPPPPPPARRPRSPAAPSLPVVPDLAAPTGPQWLGRYRVDQNELPLESRHDVTMSAGELKSVVDNLIAADLLDLTAAIARHFRVSVNDLVGRSRTGSVRCARAILFWAVREHTKWSYPEIGKFFDGRDHTTIMSSVKSITPAQLASIGPVLAPFLQGEQRAAPAPPAVLQ